MQDGYDRGLYKDANKKEKNDKYFIPFPQHDMETLAIGPKT